MDDAELIAAWERDEQEPIVGWDFSHLDGRLHENGVPWSYADRASELMRCARAVLDLDTGGGERLQALRASWPATVVATEAYPPNVALAKQRLTPLGAQVVNVASNELTALPFDDASFDLVLNRHGGINVAEVARVLAPGGTFLTQQVHGQTLHDLLVVFGAAPQWPDATPAKYVPLIERAGLTLVDLREHAGSITFADVSAIVYYLHAIPWLVPGFSVQTHAAQLLALHAQQQRGEPLRFTTLAYLIEARKPADPLIRV